ncbi:hypothetical protein [Streptomyces sp. NPDC014894]|uniref:hypothetical protein n=1 Tax=Streptomyces sp. NPDC014894 TaxID=3364931 RepID=UPI0036F596DA
MTRRSEKAAVFVHLAAVWVVGCALTGVQTLAVMFSLFLDGTSERVALLAAVAAVALVAFASLGNAAHRIVPLARRTHGSWIWAVSVYGPGTAGAAGAAVVNYRINHLDSAFHLYPVGGLCYALVAALVLPGAAIRRGALGTAVALVAGGAYLSWAAAQPPTLDEWIAANGGQRTLLRVGDPPPGYTLRTLGGNEDAFSAEYERPRAPRLHLGVTRSGHADVRADARGCPVPFGETIRCTDDGGGRQLITYAGGYERRQLLLRREGLVFTVTVEGSAAELSGARRVLSTLRPATDAELAGLLENAIRR